MLTELDQQSSQTRLTTRIKSMLLGALISSLVMLSSGISVAIADDTEIFTAGTAPSSSTPNVVFLIDTSGSMNSALQGDDSGMSKIQKVQNVFENLIFDYANTGNHDSVNPAFRGKKIALMRFDNGDSNGGYFITPMQTLNNGTKDNIWTEIQNLVAFDSSGRRISPGGLTPLAESAYEASRYFSGLTPVYGNRDTTSPGSNVAGITLGNGKYKSPFQSADSISECGVNNHLVILTDGLPTEDGDADDAINSLANTSACSFNEATNTDCLPQVAKHLYETNLYNETPGTNVKTHTIAFDLRSDSAAVELLAETARLGGEGMAINANSESELQKGIFDLFRGIQESSMSFVSPAVSVSSTNRFVHDNTVYFGLFKPALAPLWNGNLKGYQYTSDGELYDFSSPPEAALVGGSFAATAKSKWSSIADGGNINQGGAAEQILAQSSRHIYTQNSATPSASTLVNFSVANENNISAADFGDTVSNDLKIELIQWVTSRDSNPVGDPLHSQPVIIDYGSDTGPVIFFGTNQGLLHAISAQSGQELMAFIPKSLLRNIRTIRDNNALDSHPYGLDGYISYYRYDANGDGEIHAVDNDKAIVIVGMRRGGNEFFALDVTNPSSPSLKWHITGGAGDFADMGDSWSKPIITKMNFGSSSSPTRKDVVLIGGGYDNQYDELDNTITDPAGAALYAIDLEDGNCLWSASDSASSDCDSHTQISGMSNSIPSHVSAIDLSADGIVDRLYAIDILGKIFRVDLDTLNESSNFAPSGQLLADLSGGTRRFYYGVDVAYTDTDGAKLHLSVGSGQRSHPLAEGNTDIIASVWDTNVLTHLPEGFSAIMLDDADSPHLTNVDSLDTTLPSNANGWYFNLPSSEKVLSLASSLAGYVFFTSYTPPGDSGTSGTSCEVQYGSGNVYAVNLANASPLDNDRAIPISTTGIPSSVEFLTLLQPDDGLDTDPTSVLASQDTKVLPMVNGSLLEFENPRANEIINSSTEAVKSYWYLGEPQ